MKYLGLFFTACNCETDLTNTIGKYYGKLNNILSVLGNRRDETCAVHDLTNTYCLPTLLYASESWSVRTTVIRNLNVVWNNLFRRIFNCCWSESASQLLYFSQVLPVSYQIEQKKIIILEKKPGLVTIY